MSILETADVRGGCLLEGLASIRQFGAAEGPVLASSESMT
jgi:hypothetical protein